MKTPRKVDSPLINEIMRSTSPVTVMGCSVKMRLSALLDDMIKERGWSKTEFAEKMNKQPSEITKWLGGCHNFTIDTLCEIAVVLGVQFRDLFAEKNIQVFETKLVANVPPSDFKYPMFEKSDVVKEPKMEYSASILNNDDKRIRNSETPGDVFVPTGTIIKSIDILESTFRLPEGFDLPASIVHFDVKFETGKTTIPGEIRTAVTVCTNVERYLLKVGTLKAAFTFGISHLEKIQEAMKDDNERVPDELLMNVYSIALSTMRGMLYSQWRGTFLHHAILPEVDMNALKKI
ncbi:MAG: helix-turn-helix transcriptional regulator [Bacteroidetes bacterium]|nr:helix-turn-helix transcriptional regulator [Bacteroidota bacterium]